MKKFTVTTIVAAGLGAALVGFAAPSAALPATADPVTVSAATDIGRYDDFNDIAPNVNVPKVDTGVRHSGR